MPRNGHGRPKNNGKKPEEDKNQPHRMRNDFHQPASSTKKNCCAAETYEHTKFASNESAKIPVAFSITVLGLLIGALAFAVSLVRDRLYGQDLSDLQFVASELVTEA